MIAVSENPNYAIEAEHLSHNPTIVAMAAELHLANVGVDFDSRDFMMGARARAEQDNVVGSYIGAAGRAVKAAYDRQLAAAGDFDPDEVTRRKIDSFVVAVVANNSKLSESSFYMVDNIVLFLSWMDLELFDVGSDVPGYVNYIVDRYKFYAKES